MAVLVRIPWQTYYWLTPHTLTLLVAASKRLGYNGTTSGLMLYAADPRGLLSAWRSWSQQNTLYQAALNGGNVASNPDTGPRMHMRGGAFDLARTDSTARNACKAVGLIPDPAESWHWNDPQGTSMPIILTNTAAAGGGAGLLQPEGDHMRAILTKKGATSDGNLHDQFTPYAILHNVPHAEILAHRVVAEVDSPIDATTTAGKATAINVRANWQRTIDSNLAQLRAAVTAAISGGIVAPPAALPADIPPAWREQIAQSVRDEIIVPD